MVYYQCIYVEKVDGVEQCPKSKNKVMDKTESTCACLFARF